MQFFLFLHILLNVCGNILILKVNHKIMIQCLFAHYTILSLLLRQKLCTRLFGDRSQVFSAFNFNLVSLANIFWNIPIIDKLEMLVNSFQFQLEVSDGNITIGTKIINTICVRCYQIHQNFSKLKLCFFGFSAILKFDVPILILMKLYKKLLIKFGKSFTFFSIQFQDDLMVHIIMIAINQQDDLGTLNVQIDIYFVLYFIICWQMHTFGLHYIMRRLSFIIIQACFLIVLFSVKTNSESQQSSELNKSQIFGVRWRFGEGFTIDKQISNSQLYQLYFNSWHSWNQQTYVRMGKAIFTCSQQKVQHENFTIYTYLCRINQKPSSWTYRICKGGVKFNGSSIDAYSEVVLFQSKLRIHHNNQSLLMIGDLYIDQGTSLPCQVNGIINNQSISIVVIGSFLPSFNQLNFQTILRKLQVITSQVITIPSYHISTSSQWLFYSIYSPNQPQYYSFLQLQAIKTIFLQINHQTQNQLSQPPSKELIGKVKSKNYFVIVLSHQSEDSSDNSKLYEQIGMDILLSSEVNQQYSNKKICWKAQQSTNTKQCPIILHQGGLLNSHLDYGVLTINNQHQIQFTHYSQCTLSNRFQLHFDIKSNGTATNTTENSNNFHGIQKVFIGIQYIAIIGLIIFTIVTVVGIRKGNKKTNKEGQNHIQLVEQIVNQSQPQPQA